MVIVACGNDSLSDGVVSGTRLRARFVQGGGLRSFQAWHDTARGETCRFDEVGDDTLRCLPPTDWADSFADAACSAPLASHYSGACSGEPAAYVAWWSGDWCTTRRMRVWTRGAVQSPTMVYLAADGMCVARAPDPGYLYYAPGEEVALADFVGATAVRADAPSRIDLVTLEADDGARQPWRTFDGELDAECWTGDGVCAPTDAIWTGDYWADDGCSVPLGIGNACGDQPRYVIDRFRPDECTVIVTLFERGAERTAGDVYQGDATSCALAAPIPEPLFEVGAALPLAPITERLEGDGRLRRYVTVTDDGFRHPSVRVRAWYDDDLGTRCYSANTSDGSTRCVPDGAVVGSEYFANPDCTEPQQVAFQFGPACAAEAQEPPRFARDTIQDRPCESHVVVYQVGPELQAGTVFALRGGVCSPVTCDPAIVRCFRVGNQLPAGRFVALAEVTE